MVSCLIAQYWEYSTNAGLYYSVQSSSRQAMRAFTYACKEEKTRIKRLCQLLSAFSAEDIRSESLQHELQKLPQTLTIDELSLLN